MEENEEKIYSKVPAKVDTWTSFKKYALYPVTVELTPYQQKVFKEVSDFWNQEVYLENGELRLRPRDSAEEEEPEVKIEL